MTIRKASHNSIVPLALGATMLLILPVLLLYPFHSDVDIYHCVAVEFLRRPPTAVLPPFLATFPGMVYLHAFAIDLFGNTELGFRALEVIVQSLTVYSLYRLSRLWLPATLSAVSCFLYGVMYVYGPSQYVGQPDGFAVLPITVGVWTAVEGYRSKSALRRTAFVLLSGACFGFATSIRPTFALLPLAGFFLFDVRSSRGLAALLLLCCSFIATLGFCLFSYAGSWKGLLEVYDEAVRYNFDVYGHAYTWHNASYRAVLAGVLILAWSGALYVHRRRGQQFPSTPRSVDRKYIIAVFATLLLGFVSMKRFAGYHLIPIFAFGLPVLVATVWQWKPTWGMKGRIVIGAVATMILVGLYPWQLLRDHLKSDRDTGHEWIAVDSVTTRGLAFIMDHTCATDRVEVASLLPSIRWRIDRPSATRFSFPQALVTTQPNGEFTSYQKVWREQYVNDLATVKPKYYAVEDFRPPGESVSCFDLLSTMPGLTRLLDQEYRYDTTIGLYRFYRRLRP